MNIEDIREHYWERAGKLLTALRTAAEQVATERSELGIQVRATALDRDANVLPDSLLLLKRQVAERVVWFLQIGFGNQTWDDAIDYDAPSGFPPLSVPIACRWIGFDRFERRSEKSVEFPPIVLNQDAVSWESRKWPSADEVDAAWIIGRLVAETLAHESPEAADAARSDSQWVRVGETPRPRRGGQGAVWKVRKREDPRGPLYALKEMRYAKARTSTAYQRFVREIEATRALNHPNIVPVVEFHVPEGDDDSPPFYVMPWADTTLRQARDLKGNVQTVLEIGVALADALTAAHEAGIIHRDVKPENALLLGPERTPALMDFGICYLMTDDDDDRLTATLGDTVGTDEYVAPELRGGRLGDVDGRVDVYSIGKTLYAALSAGRPFPLERLDDPRYDLRVRDASPALDHFYGLLERMVATDPDDRFASMEICLTEMKRALDNIRNFTPYVEGMYGGSYSPRERMAKLEHKLSLATGVARTDAVREAIGQARSVVVKMASELDDSRPLSGPEDLMKQTAFRCAEHLMAVGLPIVAEDDVETFERWLDEIVAPLHADGTGGLHRPTNVIRAASVLAFQGAAVVTWDGERLGLLRVMLDRYETDPGSFIHLSIFGGDGTRSWSWIRRCLPESNILKRSRADLLPDLDEVLSTVAGLSVLRRFLSLDASELKASVPDEGDLNLPLFAGLLPDGSEWLETLPATFTRYPRLERSVAEIVFELAPERLRDECKRISVKLARAVHWTARRLSRFPLWIGGIPHDGAWTRWCGGSS